ncbi:MAG: HD domain-containing protein [Oscillospiraceae bacterium]|nr:HD domain-containing protein [Oscillospiraceae bacterium]
MERVNAIVRHPIFVAELEQLGKLEADRVFCRHDAAHLLSVARIAYIFYLESKSSFADAESQMKELIYATAYLHDIGRARQYIDGTPHEQGSACIASVILPECGFSEGESELILDAILSHRTSGGEKPGFAGIIFRADKLSRHCFDCAAITQCDWEIKNMDVQY